jgi:hypothetical protein
MIHHMRSKSGTPKRTGKSEARADWHHIGADIPPAMFSTLRAAAAKDGVPQSVVIRWALADWFAGAEASQ